jgi:hypothetical protein
VVRPAFAGGLRALDERRAGRRIGVVGQQVVFRERERDLPLVDRDDDAEGNVQIAVVHEGTLLHGHPARLRVVELDGADLVAFAVVDPLPVGDQLVDLFGNDIMLRLLCHAASSL